MWRTTLTSPIGTLTLAFDDRGIVRVAFEDDQDPVHGDPLPSGNAPWQLASRFRRYFGGVLGALDPLPASLKGTPFQLKVWGAVRNIEPGTTLSYGELARRLGQVRGARAVGSANGANPVPLVVPCHRVIGADGSLVGYGGGLARKRWLLAHEAGQRSLF